MFDFAAIWSELDMARLANEWSVAELARDMGLQPHVLYRLKSGRSISANSVGAILAWLVDPPAHYNADVAGYRERLPDGAQPELFGGS